MRLSHALVHEGSARVVANNPKSARNPKLKSRPDKMIELGNKIINLQALDVQTLRHDWYNLFF